MKNILHRPWIQSTCQAFKEALDRSNAAVEEGRRLTGWR